MDELQRLVDAQADKLDREYDLLERLLDTRASDETIQLILSQGKRVKRESTVLVQRLAQLRDYLQP